jgi:hypothetical protein
MCNSALIPGKDQLYWLAKQGSRSVSEAGRATGWDWLKNEGKEGQKNPGYALTRAAESAGLAAAAMYAPALYSAAASSPEAYAAATPGLTASGQQAAMLAAQTGDFGAQGLLSTASAGGSPMANMVLGSMGTGAGSSAKMMTGLQGLKMMFPEQQQRQAPQAPPMQGQQGPLLDMYPNRIAPGQSSLGMLSEEERKRKLRAMGLLGGM